MAGTGKEKAGYDKHRFCEKGLPRVVFSISDTCRINKVTSDKLSTTIDSMFRWYQPTVKCYVFSLM